MALIAACALFGFGALFLAASQMIRDGTIKIRYRSALYLIDALWLILLVVAAHVATW